MQNFDLTEQGEHEVVFDYLTPGESYYFFIEFYSSDPALDTSSEMRRYTLPALLELAESTDDTTVYKLMQASYDHYGGDLYFDCFESDTYYEWLPVIYDKEAGTVTVLHEYASRNRNYVLEINRATSGDEGSFVFDIAILLYGNVETQVIENVDLTGA